MKFSDKERLDWLERMANQPDGILLHSEFKPTNRVGLGLANTGRTLREAIDYCLNDELPRP